MSAAAAIDSLPRDAARMLAVEILLAEPESLGDDVLESCLYLLRERLRAASCALPAAWQGKRAVDNTQKLDDIRRRLRLIEARLAVLQRVNVIVFEHVAGRRLPRYWAVHDGERALLGDEDAMSDEEFWRHLTERYAEPSEPGR